MKYFGKLITFLVIAVMVVSCSPATGEIAQETEETEVANVQETSQTESEVSNEQVVESSHGDVVIVGMHQAVEFLNILYTQGGNSISAAKLAQRGLLFLDETSNWIGELAEEVPTIDNGGITNDGKTITFHLREGITWHDGKPVTASDVKATWEAIMSPDNTPITRYGYDKIVSMETPDDYTVIMNFSEVFASWQILFDAIIPQHVIEENTPGLDQSEAMRTPIGFGPYKIVEWATGDYIEYEAFEDYFRGAPSIKRLIIKTYPSVDTLLQALQAKEIDIAWSMPISSIPQIQVMEADGIQLITAPSSGTERYHMNPDAPLFQDKQIRLALQAALDKEKIIDEVLYGLSEPGTSEWDNTPWENTEMVAYEYDLEYCKSTLEDAGWVDEDGDGIREKDGERLSFTHATTSGNLQRENIQLIAQQMFKECGVEMVIENKPSTDLFGTYDQGGTWSTGDYEMGGWSHGIRVPDPEISSRFLCSEVASDERPSGAQWYRYCNSEVDELLNAQSVELDSEKRTEMLFQVQSIINDDAYTIHLFKNVQVYAVTADLQNFVLHPFANFYWNPQEWVWAQ